MVGCEVAFNFFVLLLMHYPLHAVVSRLGVPQGAEEAEIIVVDALYFAFATEVVQTAVEMRSSFCSVFSL